MAAINSNGDQLGMGTHTLSGRNLVGDGQYYVPRLEALQHLRRTGGRDADPH
jgi:hypothetical protein